MPNLDNAEIDYTSNGNSNDMAYLYNTIMAEKEKQQEKQKKQEEDKNKYISGCTSMGQTKEQCIQQYYRQTKSPFSPYYTGPVPEGFSYNQGVAKKEDKKPKFNDMPPFSDPSPQPPDSGMHNVRENYFEDFQGESRSPTTNIISSTSKNTGMKSTKMSLEDALKILDLSLENLTIENINKSLKKKQIITHPNKFLSKKEKETAKIKFQKLGIAKDILVEYLNKKDEDTSPILSSFFRENIKNQNLIMMPLARLLLKPVEALITFHNLKDPNTKPGDKVFTQCTLTIDYHKEMNTTIELNVDDNTVSIDYQIEGHLFLLCMNYYNFLYLEEFLLKLELLKDNKSIPIEEYNRLYILLNGELELLLVSFRMDRIQLFMLIKSKYSAINQIYCLLISRFIDNLLEEIKKMYKNMNLGELQIMLFKLNDMLSDINNNSLNVHNLLHDKELRGGSDISINKGFSITKFIMYSLLFFYLLVMFMHQKEFCLQTFQHLMQKMQVWRYHLMKIMYLKLKIVMFLL
jgi:hypothetical protein